MSIKFFFKAYQVFPLPHCTSTPYVFLQYRTIRFPVPTHYFPLLYQPTKRFHSDTCGRVYPVLLFGSVPQIFMRARPPSELLIPHDNLFVESFSERIVFTLPWLSASSKVFYPSGPGSPDRFIFLPSPFFFMRHPALQELFSSLEFLLKLAQQSVIVNPPCRLRPLCFPRGHCLVHLLISPPPFSLCSSCRFRCFISARGI